MLQKGGECKKQKLVTLAVAAIFCMLAKNAFAQQATKLVFSAGSSSINSNSCESYTIQQQDMGNSPVNASQTTTISLSDFGNPAGTFYSDAGCSSTVPSVPINSGQNSVTLYYRKTTAGGASIYGMSGNLQNALKTLTVDLSSAGAPVRLSIQNTGNNASITTGTCAGYPVSLHEQGPYLVVSQNETLSIAMQDNNDPSGDFFNNSSCSGSPLTSFELIAGNNNVIAYYKKTMAGNVQISAIFGPLQNGLIEVTVGGGGGGGGSPKISLLGPDMINPDSCSFYSAETRNENDFPSPVNTNTPINLGDGNAGGAFYNEGGCSLTITITTVTPGMSSSSFYYKKASSGTLTMTASATGFTSANKIVNVSSQQYQPPPPPPPPEGATCSPTPTTRAVTGVVRSTTSQPLSGVEVRVEKFGCYGNLAPLVLKTDSNGAFNIPNVSTGIHAINVHDYGFSFMPNFLNITETGNFNAGVILGTKFYYGEYHPPEVLSFVQSSSTLLGGTTYQFYQATAAYNINFEGMPMLMPPNVKMGVITNDFGQVVLQSTAQANVNISGNIGCEVPPNYNVVIDTKPGGYYTFQSTAPQLPVTFGGDHLSFKLPQTIETTILPIQAGGVILQTPTTAQIAYGQNLNIYMPHNTGLTVSTIGVPNTYVIASTASNAAVSFGGDQIRIGILPGINTTIKEYSGGIIMKTPSNVSQPYGNNFNIQMPQATDLIVSTNSPISGGWLFSSTVTMPMKFGGGAIEFHVPANSNVAVKEQAQGCLIQSTSSLALPYGNEHFKLTLAQATNLNSSTNSFLVGGSVIFSTAALPAQFASGKIAMEFPANMNMGLKVNAGLGLTMQSTGAVTMPFNNNPNLNILTPPAAPFAIATNSFFSDGWLFNSTAPLAGLNFAGNKIAITLPPGADLSLKSQDTGLTVLTTGTAKMGYQNGLNLVTPPAAPLAISTQSLFADGSMVYSTAPKALVSFAGDKVNIGVPQGAELSIRKSEHTMLVKTTGTVALPFGDDHFKFTLPQAVDFNISTNSPLSDGALIKSTSVIPAKFAEGKINFNIPANIDMGLKVNPGIGIAIQSTGALVMSQSGNLNLITPPAAQVSISTNAPLAGAIVYNSSSPQAGLKFGGEKINFKLPPGADLSFLDQGANVVLFTTGTTKMDYGNAMNVITPPAAAMSVSTQSLLADGWTFNSASSQAGLKFAGDKVSIKLPQGADTSIKEDPDKLIVKTTGTVALPVGDNFNLKLQMAPAVDLNIATNTPLAGAALYKSTANIPLKFGLNSIHLTIPANTDMALKEQNQGVGIVMQSTGTLALPVGDHFNLKMQMAPAVNLNISTATSLPDAAVFTSTVNTPVNFGENKIQLTIPANTDIALKEQNQGAGIVMQSTGSLAMPLSNQLNVMTPPAAPVSIATNSALAGGLVFNSNAPQAGVQFAGDRVNIKLPQGADTSIKEDPDKLIVKTTGTVALPVGDNFNLKLQMAPAVNLNISTNAALPDAEVYKSTVSIPLAFGEDKVKLTLPANMEMAIKEQSQGQGLVMESTASVALPIGNTQNLKIQMTPAVDLNISTNTSLSEAAIFKSSVNTPLNFGENKIQLTIPANLDMALKEQTQGMGLVMQTTGTLAMSLSNNLNIVTPPAAPVSIATNSALAGGLVFNSNAPQAGLKFGGEKIELKLPQGADLSLKEQGAGIIMQTTGTTQMGYGKNMNLITPPAASVQISTQSLLSDGWVFNSASSQAGLKFAGDKINLKLPPAMDTSIKEESMGIVVKATGAAQMPYGVSLGVQLTPAVDLKISTNSSFSNGSVFLSSADVNLNIGVAQIELPAMVGLDMMEKGNGQAVVKSTASAPTTLQWNNAVDLVLPQNVEMGINAKSSEALIVESAAPIAMANAGAMFTPSSGSVEVVNQNNLFSVVLQTSNVQKCELTLPTTAQKAVEIELSVGTATGAISVQLEPNALDKNISLEVKKPAATPSVNISTSGQEVTAIGNGFAVEINPSQSVSVDVSTGVPLTFTYKDSDLAGKNADTLKVCVYSTAAASWEILPTTVDSVNKVVKAYAPHFSVFQLMSAGATPLAGSTATVTPDISTTVVYNAPKGEIKVEIPVGSFAESVNVTVSTPSSFPAAVSVAADLTGMSVGAEITLSKNIQPTQDVTITITYQQGDVGGLDENKLIVARYDTGKSVWVPLVSTVDTTNNTVTAKTNHFSTFQIMQTGASGSVNEAKVFPNPFQPAEGHTSVTFSKLPENATIKIYTLTGVLVRELKTNTVGMASWDAKNDNGENVASGVYFALIQGTGGKKTLKVGVQR